MFSNSDRWYFTKEQLNGSPSRRFGIDADKELAQRQQAANFIQDMGQRLQVTQLCINTAIVYMHRFYMFHSFTHFHRNTVATACLFLAAKVEEQPRKLEHIIKVAVLCLQKGQTGIPPPPPERRTDFYAEQAQEVIQTENILLQTLGFDVAIDHPHTYVVKCCHLVGASKDLSQTSYFMASNSLHLTTMCLQHKPTVVACFCIHLACKWSSWEIPVSSEGKPWFYYVDPGVTQELLERLTEEFLIIFDKCPNRLKKRIMLLSHNQSSAGGSGGASTALSNYPFDADCRKAMQKRREESAAAAKQADVVFGAASGNATVKVTDGFNGATGQNSGSAAGNVTKQINAVSNYNSACTNSGGGTAGPCSGAAPRHNSIPPSNVAATAGLHGNTSYSAAASSHHSSSASTYATGKSAAVPHKPSSNNFAPAPRQKVVSNNNINSGNHNNGAHHASQTLEHRKSATAAVMNFDSQQVRHHRKDGSIGNSMNANVAPLSGNGNGKFVAAVVDSLHSDIISNVVKEVVLAKQNEKLNCLKVPKKEKLDYNNSSKAPAATATANVVKSEPKSHSIFSPTFSLTESDNSANDAMFFERSSCGESTSVGSLDSFSSAMRAAASPPAPPPKNLNDRYLQRLLKQEQNKTSDAVNSNHSQITSNSTSGKEGAAGCEFASYDKTDRIAFDINDVIIGEDVVSNASSVTSPAATNVALPIMIAGSGGGIHCVTTDNNEVAQSDAVNNCSSQVSINDVAASSDDVADAANDSSLVSYDADGNCIAAHKKKKKHKEKDKHRDKEKKHHKEKKKHKEDKHHHHHHRHHHHHGNGKEHEEQSLLVPAAPTKEIVEPIKITIPKEKLKDIPMRLKIKINKDQISNSSVTDTGPFKFKIGKDDGKRFTRKRTRADRGSDISADSYSSNSEDELRSSKRTNYYLC